MKIVSELFFHNEWPASPQLYAVNDDNELCESVTRTLLDFVSELLPNDVEFEAMLREIESGTYMRGDQFQSDFSINDKVVWACPPEAKSGGLLISNENVSDYSTYDGQAQHFTIAQFRAALAHWKEFQRLVKEEGKEAWVGRKFETEI